MNQMRISYILKIFSILAALIGGVFFFWYIPLIIEEIGFLSDLNSLVLPGKIGMWSIAVLCYMALYFFWRICTRIGEGNSFCLENASMMKNIGILSLIASLLIIAGDIYMETLHYLNGALIIFSIFSLFVGIGITVVCYSLSQLIIHAAKIKEENDLTI